MKKYHIGSMGSGSDPISIEEIKTGVANGTIRLDDNVWAVGWTEWQPVGKFLPTLAQQRPNPSITSWFATQTPYGFWVTLTSILLRPDEAFSQQASPPQLKAPLLFWLISFFVSVAPLAPFVVISLPNSLLSDLVTDKTTPGELLGGLAGWMLLTLALGLVTCSLTHLFVRLGGAKYGWRTTFATLLPCQGTGYLLGAIPFVGMLLSIWPFISGILALASTQNISVLKSALLQVAAITIAILSLIVLVIAGVFAMVALFQGDGGFFAV